MLMLMVTVSPLQDPACLVDDCTKPTNLHRNNDNVDVEYDIENCGVDDDDENDGEDDDDKDDNSDDGDDENDENLVHICSHPALGLIEPKLSLSCPQKHKS